MVSIMGSILVDVLLSLIFDMSPSKLSYGESGIPVQEKREKVSDIPTVLFNRCALPCGMYVVVRGIFSTVWTNFGIYKANVKHFLPAW